MDMDPHQLMMEDEACQDSRNLLNHVITSSSAFKMVFYLGSNLQEVELLPGLHHLEGELQLHQHHLLVQAEDLQIVLQEEALLLQPVIQKQQLLMSEARRHMKHNCLSVSS